MLLLNNDDISRVLTIDDTIAALERAYRAYVEDEAVCRPRIDIRIPTHRAGHFYQFGTMEGGSTAGYFAIRMKSDVIFEQEYNGVRTQEKYASRPGRYCGLVLLNDIDSGEPVAILNDGYLQHLRVAGDAAIGVKLLAREDSHRVGMLGSGGMARAFIEAFTRVRPISHVTVYSPTKENREQYAREVHERLGIAAVAVDEPHEACRGADIVASCTDSAVAVLWGDWLDKGMHVVAVGGRPQPDAVARFDLRLRFGTTPAPLGHPELRTADEFLVYLAAPHAPVWNQVKSGKASAAVVTDLSDVTLADVLGGRAGRTSPLQITYSERGNLQGLQFFAVASAAYEAARKQGIGREIPTDWFLQDIRD
ncbi:MAG TPA: ornithine cyclodeaminase family protein [Candidatus Binatia bacterium]|nr:ornithine cyclodeaminase family protein [Candidatus Binatia bacterium]